MKYCEDCKHFDGVKINRSLSVCLHPSGRRESNSSEVLQASKDKLIIWHQKAIAYRADGYGCGMHAKYFEPKPLSWWKRLIAKFEKE